MPFTFSHPALILPLRWLPRRWFSFTGLIIGSIIPDFEYFIRIKIHSAYSHTLRGLFWFDLPLGLLVAFIFYRVVVPVSIDNLPFFFKSRLYSLKNFDWTTYFKSNWFFVITSLLLGAGSHLLWDSFTHEHGYFVRNFSSLNRELLLAGMEVPVFKLFQHLSTLLGGVIIVVFFCRLPIDSQIKRSIDLKYWILFILIAIIIFTLRIKAGLHYNYLGYLIKGLISSALFSLICTSLIMRGRNINSTQNTKAY